MKTKQENLLQQHYSLITHLYPGLTFLQFKKYWFWYWEIKSTSRSYSSQQEILLDWETQTKLGKPLSYILGQWAFYQDLFWVTEQVLTPRPETEIMVEKCLQEINDRKSKSAKTLNVAEIGVGSGAVILSVLLNSPVPLNATLTDISDAAIQCSKNNFFSKKYYFPHSHQVNFLLTDLTHGLPLQEFDLILCNPPYIPQGHTGVHPQVHQWEPHQALYLPKDETISWMLALIEKITACLKPGGVSYIEGHEDYLPKIFEIVSTKFNVELINDYNQQPRFLKITV